MAGNDVEYNNLPVAQKAKGEFQFLKNSLSNAPHRIHQGIYVLTPSGKLLKKINWGWPHPDTKQINRELGQALVSYKAMSKSVRLGRESLANSERSLMKKKVVNVPDSWIQLRNTSRGYAFQGMELFDIRHPVYNKIDKLWYSEEEKLKLIPSELTVGSSEKVDRTLLNRLLTNSHLILGPAAWWDEHNKQADMSMTVKAKKGSQILIHYEGAFRQEADSKWNKSAYVGSLLGKAIWNTSTKKFEKFTWVALGDHTLQKLRDNMHRGNTKTVRIAAKLELDPKHAIESDLTPFHWDEPNYRKMRSQIE